MNSKSFFLLVVALFTLSGIYANTEYNYELEIDYDFDEDEEIECELDLGDSRKTKTFDDNDDRDDMSFEGRFDDAIRVDCDERVDIDLTVLDLDDNRIEDIRESNVKNFEYELELFEGIISFDYNFPTNVDSLTCDLDIDDLTEIYIYNSSDDSNLAEKIEFEFIKELTFDCSEDLDELRLQVEDPLGKDIYDLYLEDESKVEFDEDTPRHKYDIAIFFTQDFNDDDEIDCDIDLDSDSSFTVEYDDSSSGSERNIEYVFGELFDLKCEINFEEAIVDIRLLEDDDKLVFQKTYENTDSIRISENDIENYREEEEEEPVVEKEEEKVIVPEVVNPPKEEKEPMEEEINNVVEEDSTDVSSSNSNSETQSTNSSSTPINETETQTNTVEDSNPVNVVYVFIAIVAIVLLIAIVVLVIKL